MTQNQLKHEQQILNILKILNEGGSLTEAKTLFESSFSNITHKELAMAENALMDKGITPQELQRMCYIHTVVYKESITSIHLLNQEHKKEGNPVHQLKLENTHIKNLLKLLELNLSLPLKHDFLISLKKVQNIHKQYKRILALFASKFKEFNIIEPFVEITPTIENSLYLLRELNAYSSYNKINLERLIHRYQQTKKAILNIIFWEEQLLIPLSLDLFTLEDWVEIAKKSHSIGFVSSSPSANWQPSAEAKKIEKDQMIIRQVCRRKAAASLGSVPACMVNKIKK